MACVNNFLLGVGHTMAQMLKVGDGFHARHITVEMLDVKFLVLLDVPVLTQNQSLRMLLEDKWLQTTRAGMYDHVYHKMYAVNNIL